MESRRLEEAGLEPSEKGVLSPWAGLQEFRGAPLPQCPPPMELRLRPLRKGCYPLGLGSRSLEVGPPPQCPPSMELRL